MMKRVNWYGANYKDWVGVSAAPVFWVASLICFVLGLSFKQGTGIYIPGTAMDLAMLFSIGLGLANTAIQVVGNDTEKEDLGMVLFLLWGASYALGIGSNVNFLNTVIGLDNKVLQFMVCWGLGIMIEVAPERLLVRWLRGVGILSHPSPAKTQHVPQVTREQHQHTQAQNKQEPRHTPRTILAEAPEFIQKRKEPNYHPISYQGVDHGDK